MNEIHEMVTNWSGELNELNNLLAVGFAAAENNDGNSKLKEAAELLHLVYERLQVLETEMDDFLNSVDI